jgi:addiction module HigA family antidote
LKRLVQKGDDREIRPDMVKRIQNVLTILLAAQNIQSVRGYPGLASSRVRGRQEGYVEHIGHRQLAHNVRARRGRNQKSGPGGLRLMAIKVGMKPPHPGVIVKDEILEPLGLSMARAAEVLGVRRATVSDLVNGKAALSPEMALRIEKAFGVSMDTLLRVQAWYDVHMMRAQSDRIQVKRFRQRAARA